MANLSKKSSSKKYILFTLVVLLLVLTYLSMRMMRTSSLWFDEIYSFMCAGGGHYGPTSLSETLACVQRHEYSPPGYHFLLKPWGTLAGWSEFSVWMLPMLAGLMTVASMYRLGYDLFSGENSSTNRVSAQVIGFSATVVLGMSAFFIQFLFELRFYIFVVLITIWFIRFYWDITQQRNPSRLLQLLFVLSVAGLLYIHYTTIAILGAVALYHLLFVKKDRAWWRVPLLMVLGALLFVPWLPAFFGAFNNVTNAGARFEYSRLEVLQMAIYRFSNSNVGLIALIGFFAIIPLMSKQRSVHFVWLIFIIALVASAVMVVLVPYLIRLRYQLYLWPLASILIGLGVDQMRQRKVTPALFLLIWSAAGLWNYFNPSPENMDTNLRLPWRAFRTELQQHAQNGDVVLFHTPVAVMFEALEFSHYTNGLPVRASLTENIVGRPDNNEYFNEASKFIGGAPRVWLGVEQSTAPNFRLGDVQRILNTDYSYCETVFDVPRLMRLELYARHSSSPMLRFDASAQPIDVTLLSPLKVDAQNTLPVLITFSHPATLPTHTYSVGLHVIDDQGQLKVQSDFGLPEESNACRLVELSLKDLPPGKYAVHAVVYEWNTGKRLMGQVTGTETTNDYPVLGTIELK